MDVSTKFKVLFGFVIILNVCVWFYARPIKVQWQNVPPAPSEFSAHATGLGDYNLSYRMIGFMLQNIGQVDGQTQSLKAYNYAELEDWFFKSYELLPQSNYVPILAAYYYGAVPDAEKVRHVISFLKVAGNDPTKDRWRWLVHAIFLARHKAKDLDLAYELAEILRDVESNNKPGWTKWMTAMIRNTKGEKEDAYHMLRLILESSAKDLHPAEVNHMIGYICEQVLTPEQAVKDPICDLNKP